MFGTNYFLLKIKILAKRERELTTKFAIARNGCSLKDVLDIIGGKWAMPIIYHLSKGKMRFKELERNVEGINTRMLVKELRKWKLMELLQEKFLQLFRQLLNIL